MSVLRVLTIGEPVLREKAMVVRNFNENLGRLLDNMAQTMVEYEGVGLAAPQIGISKQVVVIDVGDGLIELVNPVVLGTNGSQIGPEGCLSVPGEFEEVERAAQVKVRAQDRQGQFFEIDGEELLARALLHEIDHLHGILFVDYLNRDEQ